MELESIFGLPAHPLLVHIPVALIPLCATGAIAIVIWPTWRRRIGWVIVALAAVAAVASQLSAGSGEALEEALPEETRLVEQHAELGETFVWFALVFFLAVLALMVWDFMQGRKPAADPKQASRRGAGLVLSIVVVIAAVGTTYRVYQVGHSGAKSVWSEQSGASEASSED